MRPNPRNGRGSVVKTWVAGSPLSKTARFTGSLCDSSDCCGSPSRSSCRWRHTRRPDWSALCRHILHILCVAECRARVDHMRRIDRWHAGSRDTGTPSRARRVGSTWSRKTAAIVGEPRASKLGGWREDRAEGRTGSYFRANKHVEDHGCGLWRTWPVEAGCGICV